MKKFFAYAVSGSVFALVFMPFLALAQSDTQISGILTIVRNILNTLIPILITLGIVYFIYGVIGYMTAKDEEKRTEARNVMIYGIIGLFVIVSIWGLIGFLSKATGVGGQGQQDCLIQWHPGC